MGEQEQPTVGVASRQVWRQLGIVAGAVVCWGLLLAILSVPQESQPFPNIAPGEMLTWDEHILPVMQRHCVLCHGASGGLDLSTYGAALAGGNSGRAIVPGDARGSLLYQVLLGPLDDIPAMPLGQPRLPDETIALIEAWINQLRTPP